MMISSTTVAVTPLWLLSLVVVAALGAHLVSAAKVYQSAEEALNAAGVNLDGERHPKANPHFFHSKSRLVRRVDRPKSCFETLEGDGATKLTVDPFLMLDFFHVAPPAGFPSHPHRGFETVTYMLEGSFRHADSMGHIGVIHEGDAQWMTAGSGVIHSEMPAEAGVNLGLQLWINLPKVHKMTQPRYQELTSTTIPRVKLFSENGHAHAHLLAGTLLNQTGPAETFSDILLAKVEVMAHTHVHIPVRRDMEGFVFVYSGAARFGGDWPLNAFQAEELQKLNRVVELNHGRKVHKGSIVILKPSQGAIGGEEDTDDFVVTTKGSNVEFLIGLGVPLNEPVVSRGPFVMSTEAELQAAMRDYKEGRLVQPRSPKHAEL